MTFGFGDFLTYPPELLMQSQREEAIGGWKRGSLI